MKLENAVEATKEELAQKESEADRMVKAAEEEKKETITQLESDIKDKQVIISSHSVQVDGLKTRVATVERERDELKSALEISNTLNDSLKREYQHHKKGGRQRTMEEVDEDGELERKLEGIRVNSKPNVQWSDVAGLNEAKEILDDVGVIVCLYFLSAFTHRCFYLIYNPRR